MAVGGDENRLSLETLLEESITTERREFVFRVDIAKLLVGDFAFQAVEEVALQLLGGLNFFQQHDKEVRLPPQLRIYIGAWTNVGNSNQEEQ